MSYLIRVVLLSMLTFAGQAATLSYSGTFTADDERAVIVFDLLSDSSVELRTWSYAGGTNGAGEVVPAGGFDTYLSVFENAVPQLLLGVSEDRPGVCGVDNYADNGFCFDAGLTLNLTAGRYIAILTQSGNTPLGPALSDGFTQDGAGNYTGGPFLDITGSQRTGAWALDIAGDVREVPEPSSLVLFAAAFTSLAIARRES